MWCLHFHVLFDPFLAAQPKPKRVKQPKKIRDASEYDDDESWNVLGLQQDVDEEGKTIKKEIKVVFLCLIYSTFC